MWSLRAHSRRFLASSKRKVVQTVALLCRLFSSTQFYNADVWTFSACLLLDHFSWQLCFSTTLVLLEDFCWNIKFQCILFLVESYSQVQNSSNTGASDYYGSCLYLKVCDQCFESWGQLVIVSSVRTMICLDSCICQLIWSRNGLKRISISIEHIEFYCKFTNSALENDD